MDDYLGWLTAGLIFLWILDAYDARATPVKAGIGRCESPPQCAFLPAPSFLGMDARIGFVRRPHSRRS
jgi:hypothetical protein